jgi:hypothetical protein
MISWKLDVDKCCQNKDRTDDLCANPFRLIHVGVSDGATASGNDIYENPRL